MTFDRVETGMIKYIQEEIASKAPTYMKFLIYTGTFLGTAKFEHVFEKVKDNTIIQSLGVIDENNDIDIESLYDAARKAMSKVGSVEYMGIKFNEADVDSLYNYIKRS